MKKITAIIVTVCLLFTLLGYHFIYRIRLAAIKSEMKARLHSPGSREVVTLILNNEEKLKLDWEDEKEILFENEMYDVIDTASRGDQFIIRCIPDKKEKDLLVAYQKLHEDSPSPLQTGLVKLLSSYFIPASHYQIANRFSDALINYTLFTPAVCMATIAVPERPPCVS